MVWSNPISDIIALSSRRPTYQQWYAALQALIDKIESMCLDLVDVSTTHRGLCPQLDGNINHFLRSDGVQAAPPGSGGVGGATGAVDGAIIVADGTEGDTLKGSGTTLAEISAAISGRAPASHSHVEGDVTGLTDALAGKLAATGAAEGKLYIGKADGTFALANLTQGTNITITNADGAITIAAASGGVTFAGVSGTTQQAAVNNGYIPLNAALTTITLPATAAVGDVVAITGYGAGLWKLAQNASQLIQFLSLVTTTGTGGYIQATTRYDTIIVRCVVANTTWVVENAVGNLDVI